MAGMMQPPRILSVSQLSALIEGVLETQFQSLWVGGEISDVSRPHSGHIYFTLKDEQAQIRGVIWRSTAQRLRFKLEEGQQVVCHGDLDVYPLTACISSSCGKWTRRGSALAARLQAACPAIRGKGCSIRPGSASCRCFRGAWAL
jgi:exonuclease VII large subunit